MARVSVDDANAQLIVTFHRAVTQSYLLNPRSYSLSGGQRIFPRVLDAQPSGPAGVLLTLDQTGDFSIYTLTVSGPDIDPFFSSARLRFRLSCDDPFDCRIAAPQPAPSAEISVHIDYLAKDYSSFRQALLDFIPSRMPQWSERSEADIGMMLLELFAATADSLSYMQDRVANEAFLSSASQRRSVAGHLALLGYELDPGASAHTWLYFEVNSEQTLAANAAFQVSNAPRRGDEPLIIFETGAQAHLRPELNVMRVYTWGNENCCVPRDAFQTELDGDFGVLRAGDWLLLEDSRGRRDIVRLSSNAIVTDGPVTIVRWSQATPLRHDYCASQTVIRGNLVPATHGETVSEERLRRPWRLARAPLAYVSGVSSLTIRVNGMVWNERATLLQSGPEDRVFRVELDDQGEATVVFGNGRFGAEAPPEGSLVTASYRVGGGLAGNVGADVLTLARTPAPWLRRVTNPLPATGGRNFETGDQARRVAPAIFKRPLIAVTSADYQAAAQEFTDSSGQQPVQRANASFRWTGSWLTVTLAVDPKIGQGLDPVLRDDLLAFLQQRRLAGYDLRITRPIYVPVELALEFCVLPGFLPADVQQGLLDVFRQFFRPDNFSFGESLFVSRIYAAAMTAPGVESAKITTLARLRAPRPDRETAENLARGFLAVGADQIIRLDNDRNFPENGILILKPAGTGA